MRTAMFGKAADAIKSKKSDAQIATVRNEARAQMAKPKGAQFLFGAKPDAFQRFLS